MNDNWLKRDRWQECVSVFEDSFDAKEWNKKEQLFDFKSKEYLEVTLLFTSACDLAGRYTCS